MNTETRHVKYAFADVVAFSVSRTVEAQVEIVAALNAAFKSAVQKLDVIFLPTGDGICAGITDGNAPADAHLQLALQVLDYIYKWSKKSPANRRCTVRFGINESVDTIVTDINGQRNLAGAGINQAQRLMSIADGNQIIMGRAAHETLSVHDEYSETFRELRTYVKHDQVLSAYQFIKEGLPFLNTDVPAIIARTDPIELSMTDALSDPANFSTTGQISCTREAINKWEDELQLALSELTKNCSKQQVAYLRRSQTSWERYRSNELDWIRELRNTVQGTMYRVLGASIDLQLVRQRVELLREYRDQWLPESVAEVDPRE